MHGQIKDIDRLSDMKEFSKLILENLMKISENEFYENSIIQLGLLKMLKILAKQHIKSQEQQNLSSLVSCQLIIAGAMLIMRNYKRHTASGCVPTTTFATRQKQVDMTLVWNGVK